jgi:hypothetical protein
MEPLLFLVIPKVSIGSMNRMLVVKDALAIRQEVGDTLLLEDYNVFKAEKEFYFLEDIKKEIHPAVLKLYPSGGLSYFKSEIRSQKIREIITNPIRLIYKTVIFPNVMFK